ncbi:OmpA family protein [Acinetobacter venetianus]
MLDETEFSEHESESATWIALADLMTGLMAIFLVMCMIIMTNQDRTRVLIIQSVQDAMTQQGIEVDVDKATGDISISDSILFDQNKSDLKAEGKDFLRQFIPVYSQVMFGKLSKDQLKQVSRIAIEGHTSRIGSYSHNMTLSLERANSVVQFVNNEMTPFPYKQQFLLMLTPIGRGYIDANTENNASDRKVMFKFQFASELFGTMTQNELTHKTEKIGVRS